MDAEVLAGRYEILALIGVGGMGSVYRARDRELDEIVALKILRRELVQAPGMHERFRQEVKLARRVTHPNVARTFDIGEHEGNKFLTMEFIDGESLAALLAAKGRFAFDAVVELAQPLCAGLAAAHDAGVVHRDLKPDNVLVAKDGRLVINDFGIARAFGAAAAQTLGHPLGTPAYMAPEQVSGSSDVDARADVYALGVMMYELLTGEQPWRGETVYAIAAARLVQAPPDPRARRADIPDAAARLVMKCMARSPDERYASVREVAQELAGLTMPAPHVSLAPAASRAIVDAPREVKAIAVLPMRNLGAEEDAYLAEGLTDDVIDTLSMTPRLRVRSRGGVSHLRDVDRDPRETGRELGVQVVVEGSLRRVGDRIHIRARLLSVADGFQLWAKRFDRPAAEVLAVAEEVARAIAEALAVEPVSVATPMDPEAVELYLRARHRYNASWGPGVKECLPIFEQALARAPENPLVLSGYALALMRNAAFADDLEALMRARALAERAVAGAPRLAGPRIALARAHFDLGDGAAGSRELRAAAPFGDDEGDLHWLWGRTLAEGGLIEAGIERFERALRIESNLIYPRLDMARAFALLGDREAAEAKLDGGAVFNDVSSAVYWIPRARLFAWWGDVAGATIALTQLEKTLSRDLPWAPPIQHLLRAVVHGEKLPIAAFIARAQHGSQIPRRASFNYQMVAEVAAFGNDLDATLDMLEAADRCLFSDIAWMDFCPLLAVARGHPRFEAVSKNVRARAAEALAVLGG